MPDKQPFTTRKSNLSEEEVKQRFVPFLKDFYKNRYQSEPGSIKVEMDNVSSQGWVADGKLTFRKPDGTPFFCTYEATSLDKSEEVKYKLNTSYFHWDCVAFAAVCAAVLYFFFYSTRLPWLIELKGAGNIGVLLGIFIIGFFSWYFSMRHWRKYRYIFAIQQFRQYFADEQWVALAEDVFPAPNDPYYQELRNQCVYNGVGLALVPLEGNVRKINDPSRLGVYGRDKKMADWVTRAEWYRRMSENVGAMAARRPKAPDELTVLWNKVYRPLHYLIIDPFKKRIWGALRKPVGKSNAVYSRFMDAQTIQKWVTVLAIAFIAPFFWKIANFKTENIADLKALQGWNGGKNPEDERGYLIDGAPIPYDGRPPGVPKQYPIASKAKDDGPTINMSGNEDDGPSINMSGDEDVHTIDITGDDYEPEKPVIKTVIPKKTPPVSSKTNSPCDQLKIGGWIVQESAFTSEDLAEKRVAALKKQGIDSQYAAQTCIVNSATSGYLVWLGPVYSSDAAARKASAGLGKVVQGAGLGTGKLFVRGL